MSNRMLKEALFKTLEMVLSGDATAEQVEQVCYLSEQMIKDDKNYIDMEKARMVMEFERQDRIERATITLASTIRELED
jgi:hypothetical protein